MSLSEDTGSIQLLLMSPKRTGVLLDLLLNKLSLLLLTRIKLRKMWGSAHGMGSCARDVQPQGAALGKRLQGIKYLMCEFILA